MSDDKPAPDWNKKLTREEFLADFERGLETLRTGGIPAPEPAASPAEEAMKAMVAALPDPMAEAAAYYAAIVQAPGETEAEFRARAGRVEFAPMSVGYEEGATDPAKPAPGPPRQPDDLTIAALNRAARIMSENGGGTPDHVEGLPAPAPHPAPWRWDSSPGSIVATTALLDAAGNPVLKAFANPLIPLLAFVHVEPAARAVIESAGEMEALLRELLDGRDVLCDSSDGHDEDRCVTARTTALLTRLDAAKGG